MLYRHITKNNRREHQLVKQLRGGILEIGYMVPDIHVAIESWMTVMGAGPFFIGETYMSAERHTCRGVPCPLSIKLAYGLSEGVLIELIEPKPDDRSIYSEALAASGNNPTPAVNYVLNLGWEEGRTLMAPRYEEVLHVTTNVNDLRCIIYDARKDLGAYVEIGEGIQQMLLPMIEAMKRARATWDGRSIYPLEEIFKVAE